MQMVLFAITSLPAKVKKGSGLYNTVDEDRMLFISLHWLCESCARECLSLVDREAGCGREEAICKQLNPCLCQQLFS